MIILALLLIYQKCKEMNLSRAELIPLPGLLPCRFLLSGSPRGERLNLILRSGNRLAFRLRPEFLENANWKFFLLRKA